MSRAKRHKRSECRRKHVSLLILQKSHHLALIWHIFIYVEILKYIINSHSLHLRSGPGAESALIRIAHLQHDLSSDDGKWHLYQRSQIHYCVPSSTCAFASLTKPSAVRLARRVAADNTSTAQERQEGLVSGSHPIPS